MKRYATARTTPGSVADGLRNDNKRRQGDHKMGEHADIAQLLFSRQGNFSRRISDGAQPSTTPRRKRCQPPGRRSFNEGGTDDSQLRKGAWLPRSFTLSATCRAVSSRRSFSAKMEASAEEDRRSTSSCLLSLVIRLPSRSLVRRLVTALRLV